MTAEWQQTQELVDSPLLQRHGVDQQLIAQAREVWALSNQVRRTYGERLGLLAVCMIADALDDSTYEQLRDEGLDVCDIIPRLGGAA